MAKQERYRRLLGMVIAGSMLGALLGLLPAALDRLRETAGGTPEKTELTAGGNLAARGDLVAGGDLTARGDLVADPTLIAPSRAALGTDPEARRRQQLEFLRGDLARRAEAIGIQEEALRRDLLKTFWKRQAAVSVATVCLALVVVGAVLWRVRSGGFLKTDRRAEETRLRSLQMAVIGALEEFESKLQHAQRTMPGGSASGAAPTTPASAAPAAEADQPAEAGPWSRATDPGALEEGSFFSAERDAAEEDPAPTSSFFAERDALWETARQSLLRELRERDGAGAGGAPAAPGPNANAQPMGGTVSADTAGDRTGTSWARRFLEPDEAYEEAGDPFTAAPGRRQPPVQDAGRVSVDGPWGEPARRRAEGTTPESRSRIRGQIEYLSSEGWTEGEIARRLGVSREEVRLVHELRARGLSSRPLAAG